MIKALLFDFSRVLLFPKETTYEGSLNERHRKYSRRKPYRLFDHFSLNSELFDYIKSINQKCDSYIFTSETIQDDPSFEPYLKPVFKGVYSALKLSVQKKSPDAYIKVSEVIGLTPAQILFVDDTPGNIKAAEAAGLITIHYRNNQQCISKIQQYLP